MDIILQIVGGLLGLGSFVCWIMEIIAAFKREEKPLMGILSIVPCCGLGGFIIGWIHAGKWDIKKLMMIWTALIVGGLLINGAQIAMIVRQISGSAQ